MNILNPTILLISILFAMLACSKDDPICHYDRNDSTLAAAERSIMECCRENEIIDSSELTDMLIGTWELVGFSSFSGGQARGEIEITDSKLFYKYTSSWIDTVSVHNWQVIEDEDRGRAFLKVDSGLSGFGIRLAEGVFFQHTCKEYMFSNWAPIDGTMHLYRKK